MRHNYLFRKGTCIILLLLSLCMGRLYSQSFSPQIEKLDRGLLAIKSADGIFISWRFLGTDDSKVAFNLYRDGVKVNADPINAVTNYKDKDGSISSKYVVKSIVNGQEAETSKEVSVWAEQYKKIHLQRPDSAVTPPYHVTNTVNNEKVDENYPNGQKYGYTPNDCSVGDVDGDGEYEIIVKWDPSNSRDNSFSGITGNVYLDCYKLNGTFLWRIDLGRNVRAGAHYTQFMVYDFDGDGKAEIACKTAPGTKDGKGKNVIMGTDNPEKDYRNSKGYILDGPEYLTIFKGETGAEITTVAYNPSRGSVSDWGDSYGNRVDRFLACVAYLDGLKPSLVMCRGYYTRTVLVAYDFDGVNLKQRWIHDSATKGKDAYGQGNHNLSVGDVDGDGCDEIVYGACAIDHDGKLLYRTGIGHGDAIHLTDIDPDVEGLEVFSPHEEKTAAYGYEVHSAETGKIYFGEKTGTDVGRGIAADIDANHRGVEVWATNKVYNCKGEVISTKCPSKNFRAYWDGDLQDELLDGNKLDKWTGNGTKRLISFYDYSNAASCNSTKATPNLSADILGDWREEVILYDGVTCSDLLLFSTVIPSEYRIRTLMHDHVYRMAVAWQNVAYNQPPHLGYYIGDNSQEGTRLVKVGTGLLNQTVELGASIEAFGYTWFNAEGINVEGLPEGVTAVSDASTNTVTISGAPERVGTYNYTIKSFGGDNEVSFKGCFTVKPEEVITTVAYFPFNETSGNTAANEISGSANASNFSPSFVEGINGHAISFPGSPVNAAMIQNHYPEFALGTQAFSIELWFKSSGGTEIDWYLLHKGSHAKNADTGATGRWFGIQYKNNNLTFGIDDDIKKSNVDVPASDYFNGEWSHLVCVRDVENKLIKLYLDGELAGSAVDGTGDISQVENMVIGNCNVNFNTPFSGVIDELSIFTGALNADKIRQRYLDKRPLFIGQEKVADLIKIYPVIFNDEVTVALSGLKEQRIKMSMHAISGIAVYNSEYNIDGNEHIVISGLEELPKGVYTLTVSTDQGLLSRKIMK